MATLLTEAPARPETASQAVNDHASPPPIVSVKPRRRRRIGAELIAHQAATGMWKLEDGPGTYLPSPEVIAAECAAIRAEWSEEEHRLRASLNPEMLGKGNKRGTLLQVRQRWTVPVVRLGEGTVSR